MPWLDWQFYVVTAAALWGVWILARQLLAHREASDSPCGTCAVGTAARAGKPRACDRAPTGYDPGDV